MRLYGGCGENKIRSECDVRSIDRSVGGGSRRFFPLENLSSGRLQLRAATCEM